MKNRLELFARALEARGIEAALIHRPENIRYLTGYTGEGSLLAGGPDAVILTDFRYLEQAARQAPHCARVRTTAERKPPAVVAEQARQRGIRSLAVELDYLTVDGFEALKRALDGALLLPLNDVIERMRMVKSADEIGAIVRASEISCRAFEEMLGVIRPGMTEREVRLELDYRMQRGGAEAPAFDTIAVAGANGSLPHALPSDRVIQTGEFLTLDFGAQVDGYKTDMTRTVAVGKPPPELKAIYAAVLEAHELALSEVRPGAKCREVDFVARAYLEARYPGAFGHALGHGVGLMIHEAPKLSHVSDDVLSPGHVVTVEPGVYIEGLAGCRIEDTVIVREDGYMDPIFAPKQLIVL